MAWFLALQGPPTKAGGQSLIYELDESADRQKLAEEMASSATLDRVVAIPAVFQSQRRPVTLYVRPAAWGVWAFYEMSEEERRQMLAANPLVNALAQAARQQQAGQGGQSAQNSPGTPPPGLHR